MPNPPPSHPSRAQSHRAAPARGGPPPQRRPQTEERADPYRHLCDVHIVCGLIDEWIRIERAAYKKFLILWAVGRQDICWRCQSDSESPGHETNLWMRGDQTAQVTVSYPINRKRTLRQATLLTRQEIGTLLLGDHYGAPPPNA